MYTRTLGRMIRVITFLVATLPTISYAAPIQVTIDTSALSGTTGSIAFDFLDGGIPSNTVTVSAPDGEQVINRLTLELCSRWTRSGVICEE